MGINKIGNGNVLVPMTEQQYEYFKEGMYKIQQLQQHEIQNLQNELFEKRNKIEILTNNVNTLNELLKNMNENDVAKLHIYVNNERLDVVYDFPIEKYLNKINEYKFNHYYWHETRNDIIKNSIKDNLEEIHENVKRDILNSKFGNFFEYENFYKITPKWLRNIIENFYG